MPDGHRTGRFGAGGRVLFALILAVALILVGISGYVWSTRAVAPPRGSGGPLTEETPAAP